MKTYLCAVVLLLLVGCRRQADDITTITPLPVTNCVLASYDESRTSQGQGLQGTTRSTYQATFDADGLLTGAVASYKTEAAGNAYDSRNTARYQYDGAGFLQQSATNTLTITTYGSASAASSSTQDDHFTYTSNRLTGAIRRSVDMYGGTTSRTTKTETYQYDSEGRLSQYTSTDSASRSVLTYTYSAGKLTRVVQDGKDQYTIQDGRITGSPTGLTRAYDAKGRLIGTKSSGLSIDYEYAEAGQSGLLTYPEFRFKGFPFAAMFQVLAGPELYGLVQRETQYQETNGTRRKVNETVNTYQLNAQGLPIRQTTTRTVTDSGSSRTEQGTTQYTYRGCQ